MDRPPRIRRYQKKDYTQRVEFPVEIVGRDNQVRRYAFDDAIRLYQRRIETASSRYADPETIDAEVRHCRLRIEQLRRSYIEAAGGGRPAAAEGLLGGPMAADILFFLRTVLGDQHGDAAAATLIPLLDGESEAWWWSGPAAPRGAVLYAFRLDPSGPMGARIALERELSRLRAAENEPGAERMYVGTVTADLALLLAGTEPWDGPRGLLNVAAAPESDEPVDPWRAAMVALQEGQTHFALRQLESALDKDPTRKVLARAGAVIGLMAEEPVRAEFIARFGLLAAPGDASLRYFLALAQCMQGRAEEAAPDFVAETERGTVAMIAALHRLGQGRLRAALRAARRATLGVSDAEWFSVRVSRSVRVLALALMLARGSAALSVVSAAMLVWASRPGLGLGAGGVALGLALFAEVRTRRLAQRALLTGRMGGVRLVSPESLPRDGEAPRH